MKRLLLIPLALFALMLSVTPAGAEQPEDAAGEWAYAPEVTGVRTAGNTTFIYGTEVGTFTGTFEGTSNDEWVVVCHQKGPESFMTSIRITVEFIGKVDGRDGGFTMKASAKQESTACGPTGAIWYGKWVIISGTGDLADLHGNGEFGGPDNLFKLGYTGKIHFD